jgi:hypothetical protein
MTTGTWAICIAVFAATLIIVGELRQLGAQLSKAIEILHHIKVGIRD